MRLVNAVYKTIAPLALAALCLAGAAGSAHAQGAFYAEVERDGRIYVFNSMKSYDQFQKSGEMGISITRPGEGPAGETMIFDGEEAIHLYNFKHGRKAEIMIKKEEAKPVQKFSWKDGKTTFESDMAKLNLSNRLQFRYTVEDPDGEDNTKGSFRVRRMRTKLDGWAFHKDLEYELQVDFADRANVLQDANLNWDFTSGRKAIMVKGGQYKVPFGRQELTSSGNQQFVDRTVVSNEFAKGRDQGFQVWGLPMGGKVDWRLGIFNGNGRTNTANDNREYQYNGRLMFQPWGDVKYSESDFDSTDRPLAAFGVGFEVNDLRGVAADVNEVKRRIFAGDFAFKYRGFSAVAEYFHRRNTPEEGDRVTSPGWYVQGGYFVIPKHLEIAVRHGQWDPSDDVDDNDRKETGLGVGYFWNKHPLKLQGDWRRLENEANGAKDNELRIQAQFIF